MRARHSTPLLTLLVVVLCQFRGFAVLPTPILEQDSGVVKLGIRVGDVTFLCSGAPLSNTWVLTAKDCLFSAGPIAPGRITVSMARQHIVAAEIVPSPHDMRTALVRLSAPLQMFGSFSGFDMNFFATPVRELCGAFVNDFFSEYAISGCVSGTGRLAICKGYDGPSQTSRQGMLPVLFLARTQIMVGPDAAGGGPGRGDEGGPCTVPSSQGIPQLLGVLTDWTSGDPTYEGFHSDARRWVASSQLGHEIITHSGKCIDVAGGGPDEGAAIQQYTCHGGANQLFRIVPAGVWAGEMTYELRASHSSKCMTLNNGLFEQRTCALSPNAAQRYRIARDPWHGRYTLQSAFNNRCVDVVGGSGNDGARLQTFTCLAYTNQEFDLRIHAPSGAMELGMQSRRACVDVPIPSAALQQFTCNGGNNQEFRFVDVGLTGKHQIRPKHRPTLCVAVAGAVTGATYSLAGCNIGAAQLYRLTFMPDGSNYEYRLENDVNNMCVAGDMFTTRVLLRQRACAGGETRWTLKL